MEKQLPKDFAILAVAALLFSNRSPQGTIAGILTGDPRTGNAAGVSFDLARIFVEEAERQMPGVFDDAG